MTTDLEPQTRRSLIAASLKATGAATLSSALGVSVAAAAEAPCDEELAPHAKDFAWLQGLWNVRHRRLKTRLAGDTRWEEFNGTSELWLTMNGLGTFDDNMLELPDGKYRAVGIRAFNPETKLWAIWWLDSRNPTKIDPPVYGSFENGVGAFLGDDTFNGKPIKVRFVWSEITGTTAKWEQAFSPDGGKTWETNWVMHFSKA